MEVATIQKAMIFAAGLGTRLRPWTDQHPKALAPVNGIPLLQRNIEYLKGFGIQHFIINVHHFAQQIIDFLQQHQHFGCDIIISHEEAEPLETGGGLKKASWFLEDSNPFVLMNADILTNLNIQRLLDFHVQQQALATLAVSDRASSRNFLLDPQQRLCGWRNSAIGVEKISYAADSLIPKAFNGVHIINPEIFSLIAEQGKFSIVDVYLRLAANHRIYGFDHSGDLFVDVGKPEAIQKAEGLFP